MKFKITNQTVEMIIKELVRTKNLIKKFLLMIDSKNLKTVKMILSDLFDDYYDYVRYFTATSLVHFINFLRRLDISRYDDPCDNHRMQTFVSYMEQLQLNFDFHFLTFRGNKVMFKGIKTATKEKYFVFRDLRKLYKILTVTGLLSSLEERIFEKIALQ